LRGSPSALSTFRPQEPVAGDDPAAPAGDPAAGAVEPRGRKLHRRGAGEESAARGRRRRRRGRRRRRKRRTPERTNRRRSTSSSPRARAPRTRRSTWTSTTRISTRTAPPTAGSTAASASKGSAAAAEGEGPDFDSFSSEGLSLQEHLLAQAGERLSGADLLIATAIIEQIEESGYFLAAPLDLARRLGVPLGEVERVLAVVQSFDPPESPPARWPNA
jgi:hypothetical protein